MKKLLWTELGLDKNFQDTDIDNAYKNLKNKTPRATFAWKVLRDKYYREIYREYQDEELLIRAGFITDSLTIDEIDYYNLDLLTTPFDKLKDNIQSLKNPIVLLSTGGFYPIHEGHLKMMEEAKRVLTEDGYDVIGGYLSLSHDDYISTKPYYNTNQYERINEDRKYLKDNDWLMIDPWESLYVKTTINFTNVIERLEKYLQKHVDERIKVAYVFGGDNVEFMYCFKKEGLGICINRKEFNQLFKDTQKIKNNNMYFIDNQFITLSSRNLRKKLIKEETSYANAGKYLIRNEGLLPFSHLLNKHNKNKLNKLQTNFLNKFVELLTATFENQIQVKTINIEEQLNKATNYLKNKKTINLDSYYRGTYNLEVSRLFPISSYQDKYLDLIGRLGHESITDQTAKIKSGEYILVDDDSVSGRTIKTVKEKLHKGITIKENYILANTINEDIFDVVDLRDFIIGTNNSGLVVKLPNGTITRAPYVMPYINLTTRASIPPSKEKEFSIAIWQLNKEFYEQFNKNLTLKETDPTFITLMKYIGFKETDKIIDICNWHLNKLTNNLYHIKSYNDNLRLDIIEFLKSIAIDEFGFKEWKDYLEHKSFEAYKLDTSKFLVVFNNTNDIIATIGALKVDDDNIKLNSFYVKKEYRNHNLGTRLYNEILNYSLKQGYKSMILCTYDKYAIATKFYQENNFKIYKTEELERWYRKNLSL